MTVRQWCMWAWVGVLLYISQAADAHDPYDTSQPEETNPLHPLTKEGQEAVLQTKRTECEIRMQREEEQYRKSVILLNRVQMRETSEQMRNSSEWDTDGDGDSEVETKETVKYRTKDSVEELEDSDIQSLKENLSLGTHCPTIFDGIYCWPRTPPDNLTTIPCPSYVEGFRNGSEATRYCTPEGTWYQRNGVNTSWTNYTQCFTTIVVADSVNMTHVMVWSPVVRIVSYVGYSVSLATLVIAFTVLACVKRLRCPRNTLHMHLFLSFIWRAVGALARHQPVLVTDQHVELTGTWGCRLFTGLWQYFILANYAWILMEGLYLHNLIFLALFTDNSAITLYIVLGWGVPLLLAGGWVITRLVADNQLCWYTNEKQWIFWTFIRGPISISIVVSFALFLNIARELLLKLKSSTTPESRKYRYRRWARSTLVLVPLFGVHYAALLGFTYFMDKNYMIELVWLFTDQFFASFQGFFVATLYCLLNAEVRTELRKIWQHWRMNQETEKSMNFHSVFSQSRTCLSRGTAGPVSLLGFTRRRSGSNKYNTTSPGLLNVGSKINGTPSQPSYLTGHDRSSCDDLNNQSMTVSLAVVELQQGGGSARDADEEVTEATTAGESSWYPPPSENNDLECALILHPLLHRNHDEPPQAPSTTTNNTTAAAHTPLDISNNTAYASPSANTVHDQNEDLESDSGLGDLPPPSTILYHTAESCEGSPLLPRSPDITESSF